MDNDLSRQCCKALVDKCVAHLFAAANGLSRNRGSQDMMDDDDVISNVVEAENQASDALKFRKCLEVIEAYMGLFDTKYSHSLMGLNITKKHSILDEAGMITVKVESHLDVNKFDYKF